MQLEALSEGCTDSWNLVIHNALTDLKNIPMHCNLQEGDHHGGYEPDIDHLGVRRCRQGLGFADEAEEGTGEYGDRGCY